jgi:hypothetical protein
MRLAIHVRRIEQDAVDQFHMQAVFFGQVAHGLQLIDRGVYARGICNVGRSANPLHAKPRDIIEVLVAQLPHLMAQLDLEWRQMTWRGALRLRSWNLGCLRAQQSRGARTRGCEKLSAVHALPLIYACDHRPGRTGLTICFS